MMAPAERGTEMAKEHKFCYARNEVTGKTILIKRGEEGYYEAIKGYENLDPDKLNERLGVSKEEAEAMVLGSMFGWDCPVAKPGC